MATRRSRDLKMAFVLDEHALRRLDGILRETSQGVEYTVKCSDGTAVDYSSLDEVFRFPNSAGRRITSLSVNTPWGDLPQIAVEFKDAGGLYHSPVEYDVRGSERDVFHISGRLEEFISTIRQWYSGIARVDFITILLITLLGLLSLGLIIAAFPFLRGRPYSGTSEERKILSFLLGFGMWIAVFAVGGILNLVRRWLFPFGAFLIGHGADRHRSIVLWRRVIGGSFGVSLFASVVASLLTR